MRRLRRGGFALNADGMAGQAGEASKVEDRPSLGSFGPASKVEDNVSLERVATVKFNIFDMWVN